MMSSPDFRELRGAVLSAIADVERDADFMAAEMNAAASLLKDEHQATCDMLTAAIGIMVERGLFATDADAEDAIAPRAGRIAELRKAATGWA